MGTDLFTVIRTNYSHALILKSVLEADGILCQLIGVNVIKPTTSTGVEIKVLKEDLARSNKLVQEFSSISKKEHPGAVTDRENTFLVPVDLSEPSKNAASYSVCLAASMGVSRIQFLYVYYSPDVNSMAYSDAFVYHDDTDASELREESEEALKLFVEGLKEKHKELLEDGPEISCLVEPGISSDTILSYSRQLRPRMIVMGARGKDRRKESFGGSVTRVFLRANFPVLVVPEGSEFSTPKKKLRIVYSSDFDEYDFYAISQMSRLYGKTFDLTMDCIHVKTGNDLVEQIKMDGLKEYFRKSDPGLMLNCMIEEGNSLEEVLIEYTDKRDVDMLAITTRRKNFLSELLEPSTTAKIFCRSKLPMLVFHTR